MTATPQTSPAGFAALFTPKLVTVLREGYGARDLWADTIAGLTVAIVALPLSMAIAIASGAPPGHGLVTAVIGGFLVSALGGSRFQIGGPAGAFIPLVAATIAKHGLDGLAIATFMAGMMLVVIGFLRLGTYIKYIPYPVTVGFTAGIAVIIAASQVRDALGLTLGGPEPADIIHKIPVFMEAIGTIKPVTVAMTIGSLALIIVLRRLKPRWPGFLFAVVAGAAIAATAGLPLDTIGSRFGAMPTGLSFRGLPGITIERLRDLLVPAIAIALLGGIESLLSAVVADGMSGRRHRSNCELVAQGVANMASALFGGIPVTGTIARTATNVRSGARGPISGMLHAVFVLIILMVAGPLMALVPMATLAAILLVVAWNMAEKREFMALAAASKGDAVVLFAAFWLTVLVDLTVGIGVGIVLGALLFMHRMAEAIEIKTDMRLVDEDISDNETARVPYDNASAGDREVVTYRLSGAFFFGAAATVAAVLDGLGAKPKVFILDLSGVPFLDATGAYTLENFVRKLSGAGTAVIISGARPPVRRMLDHFHVTEDKARFTETAEEASALGARLRLQGKDGR